MELETKNMCGINGIALSSRSKKQINESILRRMTDVISHRGPDGDGIFIDEKVGLGHRRLSIVDVAHGAQPMFNSDKSISIIYNGEVYNLYDEFQKIRTYKTTKFEIDPSGFEVSTFRQKL